MQTQGDEKIMKIGYIRVSTEEQETARQELLMNELGVEKVYIEKVSGKNTDRPQLKEMFSFIREGDVVYVESISRLARSTKDLLNLIAELEAKGVKFVSNKENIDTDTPQGRFMLSVFAALSQLEREQILQRQKEGIAIAKAAGKYKGRQPIQIDMKEFGEIYEKVLAGECTNNYAMKVLKLKRNTYYKAVARYKDEKCIK